MFGGVDDDVRSAFLSLSGRELDRFLHIYGFHYGDSAESYAREAFLHWKSGKRQLSAQTLERLLQHLPPYLGPSMKFDLIRKLRENKRTRETYAVEVSPATYKQQLEPLISSLINKAYTSGLPPEVENRLKWLSDSDASAAQELLAGAEAAAMAISMSHLQGEFNNIERLLASVPRGKVRHTIETAYGSINISIVAREKMPERIDGASQKVQTRSTSLARGNSTENLLNSALQNLTPEQLQQVSLKATEEALNLQVEAARADQRFSNTSREIDQLVDNARRLDANTSNFKISGNYQSASGTTNVEVGKDKSRQWIILAIILGAILILVLMSRR